MGGVRYWSMSMRPWLSLGWWSTFHRIALSDSSECAHWQGYPHRAIAAPQRGPQGRPRALPDVHGSARCGNCRSRPPWSPAVSSYLCRSLPWLHASETWQMRGSQAIRMSICLLYVLCIPLLSRYFQVTKRIEACWEEAAPWTYQGCPLPSEGCASHR